MKSLKKLFGLLLIFVLFAPTIATAKKVKGPFFAQALTTEDIRIESDDVPVRIPLRHIQSNQFRLTKDGNIKSKVKGLFWLHFATQVDSSDLLSFPQSGGAVKQHYAINGIAAPFSTRQHNFTEPGLQAVLHSNTLIEVDVGDILSFHLVGKAPFGISLPITGPSEPIGSSMTVSITQPSEDPCLLKCSRDLSTCNDNCTSKCGRDSNCRQKCFDNCQNKNNDCINKCKK